MVKKEVKFSILCSEHEVCSDVMDVLEDLGFHNLTELDNSPSFDITGKIVVQDGEEAEKITQEIFKKAGQKVHMVEITTRT